MSEGRKEGMKMARKVPKLENCKAVLFAEVEWAEAEEGIQSLGNFRARRACASPRERSWRQTVAAPWTADMAPGGPSPVTYQELTHWPTGQTQPSGSACISTPRPTFRNLSLGRGPNLLPPTHPLPLFSLSRPRSKVSVAHKGRCAFPSFLSLPFSPRQPLQA